MEIKARQQGRVIVLDLHGRLDEDAAILVESVGACLREGMTDILLNLENVDFIDYLGISAVVLAAKEALHARGRLKLEHIPLHFRGLFSIAGIDHSIEIHASEQEALRSFETDAAIEKVQKLQMRRRFQRLPLDMTVMLKTPRQHPPVCVNAEMLNLSGVGAFIIGCKNFDLGDDVVLAIKLPPKNDTITLDARIVWVSDPHVQSHHAPGLGVEFLDIPVKTQERLLDFIERNLARLEQNR
jgi:anti-anti-sigma factor